MILISNDDGGKKMVEREEAWLFLNEYTHATGLEMTLVAIEERPDFACEKEGQRYGLGLVKVMRNPVLRGLEAIFEGDAHLHGQDAARKVQRRSMLRRRNAVQMVGAIQSLQFLCFN